MQSAVSFARRVAIALVTFCVATPVFAVDAQTFESTAPPELPGGVTCDTFENVAGLGPACRFASGYRVRLADGTTVLTHGFDPAPSSVEHVTLGVAQPPVCVPATEHHGLIIYARPSDSVDRYAGRVSQLRANIAEANGVLRQEMAEFGRAANYKFVCDESDQPVVANAVLGTSRNSDSFSSIVSDLRALGYTSTLAKYWIFYDDPVDCGCGGTGTIQYDDRLIVSNRNNAGPSYGVTYYTSAFIFQHENGHNIGAVQMSAPRSSGGWHCNDGSDIMCYADGGSSSAYTSSACTDRSHFDCNHDDYFNPDPAPGSYLTNHWNLASNFNRYISFDDLLPPKMTAVTCWPTTPSAGTRATCTLTGNDDGPGIAYLVDWGDGSPTERVPATGYARPGASVSVSHLFEVYGSTNVQARAIDHADRVSDPIAFRLEFLCAFDARAEGVTVRVSDAALDTQTMWAGVRATAGGRPIHEESLSHSAGGDLTIETAASSARGGRDATSAHATSSASVEKISMFGGLIEILGASSAASLDSRAEWAGAGTTRVTQVLIAGIPIPVAFFAGEGASIPGLGRIVLNDVTSLSTGPHTREIRAVAAKIEFEDAASRADVLVAASYVAGTCAKRTGILLIAGDNDAESGDDAGNSPHSATPIAPGSVVAGRLLSEDPADHYAVYAVPGEKLIVNMNPRPRVSPAIPTRFMIPTLTLGLVDFNLALFEPGSFEQREASALPSAAPERLELNVHKAGWWVIGVTRAADVNGNYTISVQKTPLAMLSASENPGGGDAADSCLAAGLIEKGPKPGTIGVGDSSDFYRLAIPSGSTYGITLATPFDVDGLDVDLYVYDSACAPFAESTQGKDLIIPGTVPKGVPDAVGPFQVADDTFVVIEVRGVNGIGSYLLESIVERK